MIFKDLIIGDWFNSKELGIDIVYMKIYEDTALCIQSSRSSYIGNTSIFDDELEVDYVNRIYISSAEAYYIYKNDYNRIFVKLNNHNNMLFELLNYNHPTLKIDYMSKLYPCRGYDVFLLDNETNKVEVFSLTYQPSEDS